MAGFQVYDVTLTGTMPLLLHGHNIDWLEQLTAWRAHPDNKKKSVKGDDRSPAWTWIGSVYHDGDVLGIPSDNLMTTIREGGARVSAGRNNLTYKRQSQSGLVINELLWPIISTNGTVSWEDVNALCDNENFKEHQEFARTNGFELFPKPAKIGQNKHIRVRPKFSRWSISGSITVFDDTITQGVLEMILSSAGKYAGIGDWRPSAPKSPGPFGTFTADIKLQKG